MYKREDFEIKGGKAVKHYIQSVNNVSTFLFKTGEVLHWYNEALLKWATKEANKQVYFSSEKEAQEFLDKFLKGQEMNLEAKREQCLKDLDALKRNLAKIDDKIEAQKDPLNKVKEYLRDNQFYYGHRADLRKVDGNNYITIPLPTCNELWTFAAWDWARNFCKTFKRSYPVHGYNFTDDEHVWIKVVI